MSILRLTAILGEMKTQRAAMDAAIVHVESAIQELKSAGENSVSVPSQSSAMVVPIGVTNQNGSRSYVDDAVFLIQQAGHPIHARDLALKLSELRGREIKRSAMESTLIRHVIDLKERSRLIKTAPSTFGLPVPSMLETAQPAEFLSA